MSNARECFEIRALDGGIESAAICRNILESLPDWFGIPESIEQYVKDCLSLKTYACYHDGNAVGFVTVKLQNEYTAEVHVMGVLSEYHRRGIGRALIERTEELAREGGREFLMVMTLDPSSPDIHYARTREFYSALGFRPLACFKEIWDEYNPCLIMVKPLHT